MGGVREKRLKDGFGVAVRELRKKAGWSQEELAERAGVHRTYLGDVERGERNIALVNIGRVARALGVSLPELMRAVERASRGAK